MNKVKQKQILAGLLAISLITMYLFVPSIKTVGAVDSIYNAQDLLSDSDLSAIATSTITFTTATTTEVGDYYRVTIPTQFGVTGINTTCMWGDANFAASSTGNLVDCTRSGGGQLAAASSTQIIIGNHVNAATSSNYKFYLRQYDSSDVLKSQVEFLVAILDDVHMTANVSATLDFIVTGTSTGQFVNGVECDRNTTATTTDFGTLETTGSTTVCQQLQVTTNASYGYTVTVEQDQEMTSDGGDNINSFKDSATGSGSTTPQAWASPTGILDADDTYGHMGLTSNDDDLTDAYPTLDFTTGSKYVGLNGTDPVEVMHHDGPTNNTTQNKGLAAVAYTAEIDVLQQAGDYESQITYICTAQY
ncbi:hypothetical protein KAJ89_04875 [Candidatus Parcubacteria bacterium]|nr:hypothetical protein [Candidatus Parcubacteria bacterium]